MIETKPGPFGSSSANTFSQRAKSEQISEILHSVHAGRTVRGKSKKDASIRQFETERA